MSHRPAELDAFCQSLACRGQHNGHRYLVIWSGQRHWCRQQWDRLSQQHTGRCAILEKGLTRGQGVLGQEFDYALVNSWQVHRVNDWLALAGTLVAGGILHLLAPPLADWPSFFPQGDEASTRDSEKTGSGFMRRFIGLMQGAGGVFVLSENGGVPDLPAENALPWRRQLPSADQQAAVAAVVRVATGRNNRPLVITADRGRGKTAALGMAAAQLVTRRPGARALLVSSMAASVAVAQRHFSQALRGAPQEDQVNTLAHLPPDAALDSAQDWDLVMVDEAASLSVGMLEKLTLRFSRLVFASTVSGYEGSGRGFELRFAERLKTLRPQARRVSLSAPLRWAGDDPLEAFFNRVFLMTAVQQGSVTEIEKDSPLGQVDLQWLRAAELTADEARLSAVFSLLFQAHYQTTPADLQTLLDSPLPLLIAISNHRVIGVCECTEEGRLPPSLAEEIVAGRRQPPGSLAAQRLARIAGNADLLTQPSWRVRRIAVAAAVRRKGVGQALLAAVAARATADGQQFVSSSFALSDPVLAFWQRSGFAPRYLGSRRDTSSGSYSLIVARSLTASLEPSLMALQESLRNDLLDSIALVQRSLDAPSAARLLAAFPALSPSASDTHMLARYLAGELTFAQCAGGLRRLLTSARLAEATPCEQRVLVGCLVRARSWSELAEEEGLAGRAAVEAVFKDAWRQVIS